MKPIALSACLILAACTAADLPDGTPNNEPASSAGESRPAGSLLHIGPEGAGGLTASIPFTVQAAERAFPGYDVVSAGEAEAPAFHVRPPGSEAPVFIITPDWSRGFAGAVSTGDSAVAGPGGVRAGLTRLGDVPEALTADCAAPDKTGAYDLVCAAGSFRLEFKGTGEDALLARQTWLPPLPQ
ncbi:MAG: hypothetical protein ACK4MQ_02675 [Hyphomonas sp.]